MDESAVKSWKKAGKVAAEALQYGTTLMKPGVPVMEVLDKVEAFIEKKGAEIGFPAQSSLNDFAAHSCPEDESVTYKEGDVAKLDVGTHVEGYVADNATTLEIGGGKIHEALIKASRAALNRAIKKLEPGVTTSEIGREIQEEIVSRGFAPVINLSGHGLGQWQVHSAPSYPNYDTKQGPKIKENAVFALEPFATNGEGVVQDSGNATVFMQRMKKPVRSPFARELLQKIETYNGLPFTTRWLTRELGQGKTKLGLKELERLDIIRSYAPLQDRRNGLVSQAEHCFLMQDKVTVLTQLDDWP
ncbi:MAG: type II methionyl aminopeptidase [Candidatus Woesearchaeota archaeon]